MSVSLLHPVQAQADVVGVSDIMQPSSSTFDNVYSRAYHRRNGGLGGSSADVCRLSRCPRTVDKTSVLCQYFLFYSSYFHSVPVNTPVSGCPHVPSVLPIMTSFFLLSCHYFSSKYASICMRACLLCIIKTENRKSAEIGANPRLALS